MSTGYDLLEHSHDFRIHLLRRLVAGLVDISLIFIPVMLIIYCFDLEFKELLAGVISGFCWFSYSVVLEGRTGTTLGKKAVGYGVVSFEGPMTISKVIVRNVPKMFWYIFLPIDFFVGLGIENDPRQRWVDTVAKTCVIKIGHGAKSQ